ncbi:MAG TPA: endonuclease III [Acidobacteriaceae bacterium]|jgi:endonuclease-3|nr:endonuclease III [Acidobacteriaceae bacterium]
MREAATISLMAAKTAAKKAGKKTARRSVKAAAKAPAKKTTTRGKIPAGKTAPAKAARKDAGLELDPKRIAELLRRLAAAYPNAECALHHRNPWELLVATILSAQCTDARVNLVTPELFRKFPTPQAFAEASLPAIEEEIRSTGFYHNKAKSISGAAKAIVSQYGGRVPETMAELLPLPGVARKTANVVLGVAFGKAEGVVVDTHVLRLSYRLGLTRAEDPKQVEEDLMRIIPRDRWIAFSHEMIHHGRQICIARKPRCIDCPLENLCHAPDKTWSSV